MSGQYSRDTLGIAEEAAHWLMALKDADTAERSAFVKWLRSSPRHVEEFLLVTASDQALKGLDRRRHWDVDQMIGQLNANVVTLAAADERRLDHGQPVAASARHRSWKGVALAASVLLATGWWLGAFTRWDTYATTVGEQRAVQLADGSLVHLNARSRLAVRLSDARRDVRLLEGEALFKVARDAARPFRVQTDRAVIRALGTQFNVDRRPYDTSVAVLEGAVEVTPTPPEGQAKQTIVAQAAVQQADSSTKLAAGEEVRIASGGVTARLQGNTADAVAWRERRLVFSDSALEEIAMEFNRYNRTPQLVIDDETLRDQRFGGTFEADEPLALIEFLRRTPGLMVLEEGDRLVIRRR